MNCLKIICWNKKKTPKSSIVIETDEGVQLMNMCCSECNKMLLGVRTVLLIPSFRLADEISFKI